MKFYTYNLLLLCLFFSLFGCYSINKIKMKQYHEQRIELNLLGDDIENIVCNERVNLGFRISHILEILDRQEKNDKNIKLISSLKTRKIELIYLDNNLRLKTDTEEILFPIIWELILSGKVKVFDLQKKNQVKEIIHVTIDDVSGKQEYFKLMNGDIFLSFVKTLGE